MTACRDGETGVNAAGEDSTIEEKTPCRSALPSQEDIDPSIDDFVAKAARHSIEQIRLAELAILLSRNSDVGGLARRILDDNSEALTAMRALDVPAGSRALTAEQETTFFRLAGMSGMDFDRSYLDAVISTHREATQAWEDRASSTGCDAATLLAARMLPQLQDHLRRADHIRHTLNSG